MTFLDKKWTEAEADAFSVMSKVVLGTMISQQKGGLRPTEAAQWDALSQFIDGQPEEKRSLLLGAVTQLFCTELRPGTALNEVVALDAKPIALA